MFSLLPIGLSQNPNVIWQKLNLSDLASVKQFAYWFKSSEHRLDILINNAALAYNSIDKTVDGYDICFGTNHLGHFLLTELLTDLLKRSAPSRIVIVSSLAHILVHGPLRLLFNVTFSLLSILNLINNWS